LTKRLSSKKVENNSIGFLNWRVEENLVMNNKDNRVLCLGNIGLIVAPWKFDILKTRIFANILFYSNFRGATIS